jgi:hypothetical protein
MQPLNDRKNAMLKATTKTKVCPFMCQVIPVPGQFSPPGRITAPGPEQLTTISFNLIKSACLRDECMMWRDEMMECDHANLWPLIEAVRNLQPARTAMHSVEEAIERLIRLIDEKMTAVQPSAG